MKPRVPKLSVARCFNHADREAAARCTSCGRSYCRECVAEHGGRMICGACLRKEQVATKPAGRRWLARIGAFVQLAAAIAVAWWVFFAVGRALLMVPSSFHEGTLWRGEWWREDEP